MLQMTNKELRARYKNTIFGFLWMVINPVMQMFVIGFIFNFFVKEPLQNYHYYLLIGLLVWNFFSLSLSKSTPSIVNERSLIKKAKFPNQTIPLSIIASNLVHLTVAFCILFILMISTKVAVISNLPNILLGFILLTMFTVGISLLTSALNVKFRDVNFFVQAILIVWFYATPIVYSIHSIPYNMMWLWRLNPLTSIVQLFQSILTSSPGPGIAMLGINFMLIILCDLAGIIIFAHLSKNFDDWI